MSANTVIDSFKLSNVTAIVCEDGSAHICGVTVGNEIDGARIVGNGTLPHPLRVELTGAYAIAPELLTALESAFVALGRAGGNYEPDTDEPTAAFIRAEWLRARATIAKAQS